MEPVELTWEQVEAEAEAALREVRQTMPRLSTQCDWVEQYIRERHPAWYAKMSPDILPGRSLLWFSSYVISHIRVSPAPILDPGEFVKRAFQFATKTPTGWMERANYECMDYLRARIPPQLLRRVAAETNVYGRGDFPPLWVLAIRRGIEERHELEQSNIAAFLANGQGRFKGQGSHVANLVLSFLSIHVSPRDPIPERPMVQRWVPPQGRRRRHIVVSSDDEEEEHKSNKQKTDKKHVSS